MCTVLSDCLEKRPNARKVETFLVKQLRALLDTLSIDASIMSKTVDPVLLHFCLIQPLCVQTVFKL